jgi:hypothetical protein
MKTLQKKVILTKTTYQCEICGEESSCKMAIEECEKQHKCKHDKFDYRFNGIGYDRYIEKTCAVCCKIIDTAIAYEFFLRSEKEKNELLKKIFDVIKNHERSRKEK